MRPHAPALSRRSLQPEYRSQSTSLKCNANLPPCLAIIKTIRVLTVSGTQADRLSNCQTVRQTLSTIAFRPRCHEWDKADVKMPLNYCMPYSRLLRNVSHQQFYDCYRQDNIFPISTTHFKLWIRILIAWHWDHDLGITLTYGTLQVFFMYG